MSQNAREKSRELDKMCRFCEYSAVLCEEDRVLCEKKGIVSAEYVCRAFRYDPLKRVPGRIPEAEKLDFVPLEDSGTDCDGE